MSTETDEFGIWTDEPTVRSRVAAAVAGVKAAVRRWWEAVHG